MVKPKGAFDYYVRSMVAAGIALAILGVICYEFVTGKPVSQQLAGWGGLIVGGYLGGHLSRNGSDSGQKTSIDVPPQATVTRTQVDMPATEQETTTQQESPGGS